MQIWRVVRTSRGDYVPRPDKVLRFRWRWLARRVARFISTHYAIATVRDEGDKSNVVQLRRAA